MTGFTVTDEAVEAAARAHWDAGSERFSQRLPWAQLVLSFPIQAGDERAAMRVALEAAARTAQPAPEPDDHTLRDAVNDLRAWTEMQREAAGTEETDFSAGEFLAYKRVLVHLRKLLAMTPHPQLTATREKLTEALAKLLHYRGADDWYYVPGLASYLVDRLLASGVVQTEAEVRAAAVDQVMEAVNTFCPWDGVTAKAGDEIAARAAAIRAGGQA